MIRFRFPFVSFVSVRPSVHWTVLGSWDHPSGPSDRPDSTHTTYTHTHINNIVHTYIHTYNNKSYTHIYIYIHVYTHTYIYTYITIYIPPWEGNDGLIACDEKIPGLFVTRSRPSAFPRGEQFRSSVLTV